MPETKYRNRRAWQMENSALRVTLLVEGGHIAEIFHKASGVNPLWTPPWPSIEPSTYDPVKHQYGSDAESRLLAGIMGHNLCLDLFGGVTAEEAAAGMTVHGESSVAAYRISEEDGGLVMRGEFPQARLGFERRIRLDGDVVRIRESVTNLSGWDRPSAWTHHVTLGPPFLEHGTTEFRAPGTRSRVFETDFAGDKCPFAIGADFDWPMAPKRGGGAIDLRRYTTAKASGGFTTVVCMPNTSPPADNAGTIQLIAAAAGRPAKIDYRPPRVEDMPFTHADLTKARRLLAYAPCVEIEAGVGGAAVVGHVTDAQEAGALHAHVGEIGGYWQRQWTAVIDAGSAEPVSMPGPGRDVTRSAPHDRRVLLILHRGRSWVTLKSGVGEFPIGQLHVPLTSLRL
jgi:hypothetical protein